MAVNVNEASPAALLAGAVARDWWMILVRGLAAIAFGAVCFLWPATSLLALVLVWGVYALVDGVGAIVWGARARWGLMVLVGAVSVVGGLIAFFWPGITALALLYLIAAWAFVRGFAEIGAAIRLRRRIENEWMLAVGGVLSIVFGVLVAMFPRAGAVSVIWALGMFSIAFGVLAVGLSFRLRSLQRYLRVQQKDSLVGVAAGGRTWDEDVR